MAFNKAKTVESAIKYLNQGKISEAIREYQQVLRYDPKDQITLMTVGDLFARQGDMAHAIEYFERLAQVYLSEGFNSKAIAIYKKIAKLAPNELQPLERLADLYVQQGVLSEARPLFLQIAEAHLKANHSQKAIEVLRRLVEIEPENLRVQMRLADLYNTMGQKKEAADNYLNAARRLSERGDAAESQKLIDRALEVDPQSKPAAMLKAQVAASNGHPEKAVEVLRRLPESKEGGETTNLLLDCLLKTGNTHEAIELVRSVFSAHHECHELPCRLAKMLLEAGHADEAYKFLVESRDALIDAGEQDTFREVLTSAIERLPSRIEPLETLVDFYRRTSDSFRLPDAMIQMAQAQQAAGNYAEAEELIAELVEKNPDNEKFLARLNDLRSHRGLPAHAAAPPEIAPAIAEAPSIASAPAPVPAPESELSEETQRYIAQALTDVDLFSSYGLAQKAMNLLENILERAPRHVPTLERLLDLSLASGNERRIAQLAAQLEQIHAERGDTTEAEKFTELRGRFERAADLKGPAPAATPAIAPSVAAASVAPPPITAPVAAPSVAAPVANAQAQASPVVAVPPASGVPEFSVPVTIDELSPEEGETQGVPAAAQASSPISVVDHELDLSDEWEALAQEFTNARPPAAGSTPAPAPDVIEAPVPPAAPNVEHPTANELFLDVPELSFEPDASDAMDVVSQHVEQPEAPVVAEFSVPLEVPAESAEPETALPVPAVETAQPEFNVASELPEAATPEVAAEIDDQEPAIVELSTADDVSDVVHVLEESGKEEAELPEHLSPATPISPAEEKQQPTHEPSPEFEFELVPSDAESANAAPTTMPGDFFSELAAEVEALDLGTHSQPPAPTAAEAVRQAPIMAAQVHSPEPLKGAAPNAPPAVTVRAAAPSNGNLSGLDEVFEEFRSELGEMNDLDEDLETHYNLGIAYREMGLLDEAIGEFQKVAKAVQNGKSFRYAMQCSTLLGVTFMDKGDPKIAALWYLRALDVPGIDQETILALRYDLGVAQDLAGDSSAALESFRQVYAMNIDYRDVADRIATLRKR